MLVLVVVAVLLAVLLLLAMEVEGCARGDVAMLVVECVEVGAEAGRGHASKSSIGMQLSQQRTTE